MQDNKTTKELLLKEIINLVIMYDHMLRNKKLLFITETKKNKIETIEVMFKKENFFHLTGLKLKNNNISSSLFYQLCLNHKLSIKDFELKNNMSKWKLEVLPQIIKIDRLANQIGEFSNSGNLLKTDILVGTTRNAVLGLKFIPKNKIYIPNTVLKEDIRKIANRRNKVIAIMKKDLKQSSYKDFTYINKRIEKKQLFQNAEIASKINLGNCTEVDKAINVI